MSNAAKAMSNAAKAVGPETVVAEVRQDSWANPASGMGVPGVDPRTAWVPYARTRNQQHMRDLWLGDGLAGRIVEHPAEEMTRERGKVVLGEGLAKAESLLAAQVDELDAWAKACKALKFRNAYGGGGLVMALEDGMDWSQPVDEARLQRVRAIHHATPDELWAVEYFDDDNTPLAGKPAVYRWQRQSLTARARLVHASRVITFNGIDVDDQRLVANGGWGDSVLARCEERIRDTASALSGMGVGLQNFCQDVITSEKMGKYLAEKDGKRELQERLATMRMAKSMIGVLLLGPGESYVRQPLSFAGVADAMDQLAGFLCAVTGMPKAVLMGYAEAGLGDAAKSQRLIWHDKVRGLQANELRPAFNRLIRLLLLSKAGPTGGVEPPTWRLDFNPLEKPTPAEDADLRHKYMLIDTGYAQNQMLRPEHVARHRFSGEDGFNPNLPPDPYMSEDVPPYQEPPAPAPAEDVPGAEAAPAAVIQDVATALRTLVKRIDRLEAGKPHRAQRGDSAAEYALLLARELKEGTLSEEEVLRKVAKLYGVRPKQARGILRKLGARRTDAAGLTHFPRQGDGKPVGLKASRFSTFDVAYAQDLRENWPEVWALSSNPLGNRQFERLLPLARAGGTVGTESEAHAVRLREEWARRNAGKRTPAGVVALVKQLVVGRMGEAAMKEVLARAKEKARRARGAPQE